MTELRSFPCDWRSDTLTVTLAKREEMTRKCRNAVDFNVQVFSHYYYSTTCAISSLAHHNIIIFKPKSSLQLPQLGNLSNQCRQSLAIRPIGSLKDDWFSSKIVVLASWMFSRLVGALGCQIIIRHPGWVGAGYQTLLLDDLASFVVVAHIELSTFLLRSRPRHTINGIFLT